MFVHCFASFIDLIVFAKRQEWRCSFSNAHAGAGIIGCSTSSSSS